MAGADDRATPKGPIGNQHRDCGRVHIADEVAIPSRDTLGTRPQPDVVGLSVVARVGIDALVRIGIAWPV